MLANKECFGCGALFFCTCPRKEKQNVQMQGTQRGDSKMAEKADGQIQESCDAIIIAEAIHAHAESIHALAAAITGPVAVEDDLQSSAMDLSNRPIMRSMSNNG